MSAERRRKCAPRCQCADAFDWLVANGHSLAGLTGQDSPTLRAIAHCWVLYARSREPSALVAMRALLSCMQPEERHLARELGEIIAVLELVDCLPTDGYFVERRIDQLIIPSGKSECVFGNYERGRYGWITRNVRRLSLPVAIERIEKGIAKRGGALGLYELSAACESFVRAVIECQPSTLDRNGGQS